MSSSMPKNAQSQHADSVGLLTDHNVFADGWKLKSPLNHNVVLIPLETPQNPE